MTLSTNQSKYPYVQTIRNVLKYKPLEMARSTNHSKWPQTQTIRTVTKYKPLPRGSLWGKGYGKGRVAVVSPAGDLVREIDVLGSSPSNLCFGGVDGCTVYVTEVEHTRLVGFRVDQPGVAWQRWNEVR